MGASHYGSDELANQLLPSLIAGKDFTIPEVDVSGGEFAQPPGSTGPVPQPLSNADLTSGSVNGTGLFDILMGSIAAHLRNELVANRITGAEYTKAWIAAMGAALSTANTFLLGKDQAYWQARLVQAQAETAEVEKAKVRVELEVARVAYVKARIDSETAEVQYALGKMKLSTEDQTYANLGQQFNLLNLQCTAAQLDNANKDYVNTYILPLQKWQVQEQANQARAQTADDRFDGSPVVGTMGKQKELYAQQIWSYQRDAENKAAKLWADSWTVQKTQDEGLQAPLQFINANINTMLTQVRANVGLPG